MGSEPWIGVATAVVPSGVARRAPQAERNTTQQIERASERMRGSSHDRDGTFSRPQRSATLGDPVTTRERTVELPNGPMRVRERGRGDRPPLIWTHGMFHPIDVDDHSTLGRVLNAVEGHRVIRYDTRGHGRTPPAESVAQHRWDALGAELLALADALGVDRFVAGGISMGAAIALHGAVRAPERFAGVVLLAPPTGWELRAKEQENYRALAALGGPEAVSDHVRREFEAAFGGAELPPALHVMLDSVRDCDPRALDLVLRGAAESDLPAREALSALSALRVPVLIMPWEGDPGHPIETARALAASLPNARTRLVGGFEDEAGIAEALGDLSAILS